MHEPVGSGNCSACHNPHVGRYKGLLRSRKGQSSVFPATRIRAEAFKKGIVHEPINLIECTVCHEPHAAAEKGLVAKNIKASCLPATVPQQNDKVIPGLEEKYKFTHEPYLNGECGACHQPHNSDRPMLLTRPRMNSVAPATRRRGCRPSTPTIRAPCAAVSPATIPHGSDRPALIRNCPA